MSTRFAVFYAVLLFLGVAGCGTDGPAIYPVSGTVTYNGAPVENAQVTFIPENGSPGTGQTDASGKYQISTRGKDGAALGLNKVTIVKMSSAGPAMPANPTPEDMIKAAEAAKGKQQTEMMLPDKYGTAFSSGLTADVKTDQAANVFDFSLTD